MRVVYAFDVWRGPTTMAQIAREVAAKHGLTVDELRHSRRRTCRIAWPRHEAMWRMRQETIQSLPAIAKFFGGMDHTSILHGVRAHDGRRRQAVAAVVREMVA